MLLKPTPLRSPLRRKIFLRLICVVGTTVLATGLCSTLIARRVLEGQMEVSLLLAVLLGTTAILFLLVTFVALRLSRDVTQPILHLRESFQKLNGGHWTHTRSVFTGDELEILDREAARLASRLEEAYTSLEEKVAERTQQLAEAHSKDEALLESMGEGVLAMDMTGKVITCNHAAEQMLQWDRDQILGGHFTASLVLHAEGGKLLSPHKHLVQNAIDERVMTHTSPERTVFCERKDGTTFPIAFTAEPFLIGMEMKGVVVTFRDITEEKNIDTLKTEFISLASHQLRTPLTAIGWYIELLEKEAEHLLSEEQKDYIAQIVDSHKRMVDLVNALLNVSRIELGRLKIDPEKTDVRGLVDATVRELLPQFQMKKLKLTKRLPKAFEASIDPRLVQIVLENLLSNAVKYTPVGGSVELNLIVSPQEMLFEVRDTGYGIPKAQEHRIFGKLFRADNVLKTDTVGTGLGLYISKSSVEAWGGKLWFESQEGHGTKFRFTVPLKMKKVEGTQGLRE